MPEANTINACFRHAVAAHGDRSALRHKQDGAFSDITFAELDGQVRRVSAGLHRLGIGRHHRVGIFSWNCPEWVVADLATLRLGAVVVPLCPVLSPDQARHIIVDSGMKLLFVENAEKLVALEGFLGGLEAPPWIVIFKPGDQAGADGCIPFQDLVNEGDEVSVPQEPDPVGRDDAATVVYTSGTTGEPRGVVLTHGNITANAGALIERFALTENDSLLSFLPLSHMFERTCGYYSILFPGGCVAYAQNLQTIVEDLRQVRPTILITVPRVLEKIYQAVTRRIVAGPRLRRKLVDKARNDLFDRFFRERRGEGFPLSLKVRCLVHELTVKRQFRKIGGGRLRVIVSGGASLDRKLSEALHIFGYSILEGYGLTETSPVVSCGSLSDPAPGTVGKPLDGVEVRIGDGREILVRGSGVMKGYLHEAADQSGPVDREGWLHTGDQGEIDPRGNLVITGRIKDLIVTSYGKKVVPAGIEALLSRSRFIDQAVLVGDGRKCLVALIVPERERMERLAGELNLQWDRYPDLLASAQVRERLGEEIRKATAQLSSHEQVKDFVLIAEEPTVAGGMLSSTMKLRRGEMARRYEAEVETLYRNLEKDHEA